MIQNHLLKLLPAAFLLCYSIGSIAQNKYQAPKAVTAPSIDGNGNDACWSTAPWYNVDQLWALAQPSSAADFSERFKVSWDANKLYVLAEVTDDVLSDVYPEALNSKYYEDDTWEVFIDEDNSGGEHENNYNAFAYHISKYYDAVDKGTDGMPHLYNSHVNVKRTATGNVYTWEAAFDVYTDKFVLDAANNPKATLSKGKILGFALAYCDNDGGASRESFMGSEVIAGADKNVAYKNASVFGDLELVDVVSPSFSHVAVTSGLTSPTAMAFAPDGRIFICEQTGKLRVVKNGQLLSTPAITAAVDQTKDEWGATERGLLGIAIDPAFSTNQFIYLYYTTSQNGAHNRVSRFTFNGDLIIQGSELILLELDPLSSSVNHNGGAINFGKDGKLYIATGDNYTGSNAQNLDNTHGKLLRINSDGSIPSDNPYSGSTGKRRLIWAHGLRNPFTFDVHPNSGKIFVNNVGSQDQRQPSGSIPSEEINDASLPGLNFGWPIVEGFSNNPSYANPVFTYIEDLYTWNDTIGCAITGGTFFNPSSTNYPSKYIGKYFFMDYCARWIAVLDPATGKRTEVFAKNISPQNVYLKTGPDGLLYYLSRPDKQPGVLYKIVYSGDPAPDILDQPDDLTAAESQPAVFKVQANGAIPLTYLWRKNGVDLPNSNSDTYTINAVTKADTGKYSVVVTNQYGNAVSKNAYLTVTAFNSKPTAKIVSPTGKINYSGGDSFTFTGSGTDDQDGELSAGMFTWKVDLHHAAHVHGGIPVTGAKTFTITTPVTGETATNVWFRIYLIVQDAGGLTDTTYIEIFPNVVDLTVASQPAGMTVMIDDTPQKANFATTSVVKMERTLNVTSPQVLNGKSYRFVKWSNGGSQSQTIITPSTNTTYTAEFEEIPVTNENLIPSGDAYVQVNKNNAPDATSTFGTLNRDTLIVKNYDLDPDRETYISFDLSQLKGNLNNLFSAKLKLYGGMINEAGPNVSVDVREGKSNTWAENTITWNNKPGSNTAVLATQTFSSFTTDYVYWDLTSFIKNKLAGSDKTITLVLSANTDSKNRIRFNSKENAGPKPQLVVEYEVVTEILPAYDNTNVLEVYPNPAAKAVSVTMNSETAAEGMLEITDQVAAVKISEKIDISQGRNSYRVNLEKLKPGMYILHIRSGNQTYSEKLVVE
jgi:glucose/arabinose dehydrogenase